MNYIDEKVKEKFEHNFLDGEPIENNITMFSVQGVLDVLEFFLEDCQKREQKKIQREIQSVLTFLEGNVDRQKIINYIKEYLSNNK